MFTAETRENYTTAYLIGDKGAEPVVDPSQYVFENTGKETIIYILVEDTRTKCQEYFSFKLIPTQGIIPEKPKDVVVCESYALPKTKENERYYTEPGAKGKQYKGGDVLEAGEYKLFLFADNGQGCYEEVSFSVKITARPQLKTVENAVEECTIHVLKELPEDNYYFIEVQGVRIPMKPGDEILESGTTVYIVAESKDKVCIDETSYTVTYLDCPIPKGFSPNGDGINDTFDLSNHGISSLKVYNRNGAEVYSHGLGYTNQWDGKDKSGKQLPSGTYYYVIEVQHKTRTGWVQISK